VNDNPVFRKEFKSTMRPIAIASEVVRIRDRDINFPAQAIAGDAGYNNIAAGVEATDSLMRGFTTVRDEGGPVFGLKSAIDSGIIAGRVFFPQAL